MNTKTWWQSKTIWGTLIAALGTLLSVVLKKEITPEEQTALTEFAGTTVTGIGLILAIIGRLKANKPIE